MDKTLGDAAYAFDLHLLCGGYAYITYTLNDQNLGDDLNVARFDTSSGSLDTSYGDGGAAALADDNGVFEPVEIAIDEKGRAIVAAHANGLVTDQHDVFAIYRLDSSGELDSNFGNGGIVYTEVAAGSVAGTVVIDQQQRIVAGGHAGPGPVHSYSHLALARYDDSDGDHDTENETITGTSGADHYYVRRDGSGKGAHIKVWEGDDDTGTLLADYAFGIQTLTFNTLAGSDQVTVDNSGGNPTPPGGIFFNAGADADVFRAIGASTTNTADLAFSSLTFSAASGIYFVNTENVRVSTGTFEVDGNLSNTYTLNVQDDATLNLNFTQPTAALSMEVESGGAANFNATQRIASVTIDSGGLGTVASGGNKILVVNSLTVGGLLDLTDEDLMINYTGSSPISTIKGYLISARNGSGNWTGSTGITSNTASSANYKTLGLLPAADYTISSTFDGESVGSNSILVKYTWYGDTDFNGVINGSDYAHINAAFNNQFTMGYIGGWLNGDFDFNDRIDGSDFGNIDGAYNYQVTHAEVM